LPCSESHAAQAGVILRSRPQRPAKLPVVLADGHVVDARMTYRHQPLCVELPVLVAKGTKPVPGVVMPLVREPDCDAIILKGPELLDQTIVQLSVPFAPQERHNLPSADDELRPIAPCAVRPVRKRDPFGIARV